MEKKFDLSGALHALDRQIDGLDEFRTDPGLAGFDASAGFVLCQTISRIAELPCLPMMTEAIRTRFLALVQLRSLYERTGKIDSSQIREVVESSREIVAACRQEFELFVREG